MASHRSIPLHRFAIVASSGMVAFLALWQGIFSMMHYRPCAIQNPNYILAPNPNAAITEFGIAILGLFMLYLGTKRLRTGYNLGLGSYYVATTSLLLGQGILAYIFLRLSTCAG